MRAQLYNEPPLTVSPSLAAAVGLNEAIVLQQVHYWTQNSEKNERNLVTLLRLSLKVRDWIGDYRQPVNPHQLG